MNLIELLLWPFERMNDLIYGKEYMDKILGREKRRV